MVNIYENQEQTGVSIPNGFVFYADSKYTNVIFPLIGVDYTVVPYAASAAELADVIEAKKQELKSYYLSLNAADGFEFDFRTIFGLKALYMVPVHTNQNAALDRLFAGFDVAVAELVVIAALPNVAAVDLYLVDSTPAWPA